MSSACHASRFSTKPPPRSVIEALGSSSFHPAHPAVTVCETHTATVLLAGDRAYKIKKPVRMKFLDFSTLEQRRLEARAAAGVERAASRTVAGRCQLGAYERVQHGVEVFVPRFEDVVVLGHGVEKACGRPPHLRCFVRVGSLPSP